MGRCHLCGLTMNKQDCVDHVQYVHINGLADIPNKAQQMDINNNSDNGAITDYSAISARRYEIHTPSVIDLLNEVDQIGKKRKFQILCEGLKKYYWKLFSIDAECTTEDLLQYIREWVDCGCTAHVETYTFPPRGT